MPEYQCSPLWSLNSDNFFEPIELDDLDLPDSIVVRIRAWKKLFDQTYDLNKPDESGFKNDVELEAFEKEGIEIWKQILKLFPDDDFVFFSVQRNQLYSTITGYVTENRPAKRKV